MFEQIWILTYNWCRRNGFNFLNFWFGGLHRLLRGRRLSSLWLSDSIRRFGSLHLSCGLGDGIYQLETVLVSLLLSAAFFAAFLGGIFFDFKI